MYKYNKMLISNFVKNFPLQTIPLEEFLGIIKDKELSGIEI